MNDQLTEHEADILIYLLVSDSDPLHQSETRALCVLLVELEIEQRQASSVPVAPRLQKKAWKHNEERQGGFSKYSSFPFAHDNLEGRV
jgi:hypothetical protein